MASSSSNDPAHDDEAGAPRGCCCSALRSPEGVAVGEEERIGSAAPIVVWPMHNGHVRYKVPIPVCAAAAGLVDGRVSGPCGRSVEIALE